jgi:hypothetical protein
MCGLLEGRSRFARLGLFVHITAGFMNPGIKNRQVLEIYNASNVRYNPHGAKQTFSSTTIATRLLTYTHSTCCSTLLRWCLASGCVSSSSCAWRARYVDPSLLRLPTLFRAEAEYTDPRLAASVQAEYHGRFETNDL